MQELEMRTTLVIVESLYVIITIGKLGVMWGNP